MTGIIYGDQGNDRSQRWRDDVVGEGHIKTNIPIRIKIDSAVN